MVLSNLLKEIIFDFFLAIDGWVDGCAFFLQMGFAESALQRVLACISLFPHSVKKLCVCVLYMYSNVVAQSFVSVARLTQAGTGPEAPPSPLKALIVKEHRPSLDQCSLVGHHCSSLFALTSLSCLSSGPSIFRFSLIVSDNSDKMNPNATMCMTVSFLVCQFPPSLYICLYPGCIFFSKNTFQVDTHHPSVQSASVCLCAMWKELVHPSGHEFGRPRHLALTIWQDNQWVCACVNSCV